MDNTQGMTDLSKLRPELAEAVAYFDQWDAKAAQDGNPWRIIRAELLRLAERCEKLKGNEQIALDLSNSLSCTVQRMIRENEHLVGDCDSLRAKLEAAERDRDDLRAKLAEVDADRAKAWTNETRWRRRAEQAERERDEWRRKVVEAPKGKVVSCDMTTERPTWQIMDDRDAATLEIAGKRVRLVVEDSE